MQRAGNLIRNKMSQHMRLCIFKMLTQKKGEQNHLPVGFWIPDIDLQFLVCYTNSSCFHFLKHTYNEWISITGEEVMLIWSNVDIFFSFPPAHKILALISGHFKPSQIFLLPVFTVSIPAVYMILLELL